MEMISLIIPCYNEEEALPYLFAALKDVMSELSDYKFELLFVNDGSKDKTLDVLKNMAKEDERVFYLSFSRNFGKEAAMYAGFCNAKGDYVAVMDADMQDPPSLLKDMIKIIKEEGYDSVATRRFNRKGEPPIRSFFARTFYKIINKLSDAEIVDGARDFRLMKREMVDAIVAMSEYNRFSKGIFGWIGFKTKWLAYENVERVAGQTKWNFWQLTLYAVDGIVNFSQAPLYLASWSGIFLTFMSAVMILVIIIRKLIFGDPVQGWASTACIIIFVSGVQLFCIGIMGQYMSKMYLEVKNRPQYIIADTNRKKEDLNKLGSIK